MTLMRTEPSSMPAIHPATIAAAIEANLSAYMLSFADLPGATAHRGGDLVWVDSGVPTAVYNAVIAAWLESETVDARVQSVIAHFERVARPVTWHIGPTSTPGDLGERLLAHGFAHSEDEPGMAASLADLDQQVVAPAGLAIDPACDETSLAEWVDVWLFPLPAEGRRLYRDALHQRALLPNAPWRYYVGRRERRPVATAELFIDAGVASVHNVVTLPELRRQGIGEAMTRHALREARQLGARVAVLTASPDGFSIYQRLGFREYCRFRRFEWEPAST
ncbi:MAG: GNAT family N-acetyltransferase [Chloroflexota bacterium]|nr:GNAT family N-acetyltransferase [Chloroflexota bacterium]